jgi:rhamnose utilization protein RhaD (predicted bifunctional aldolase and dehydrogenase)
LNSGKDNLIKISNVIGSKIEYVQGGGGNTSLKISEKEMFIKASGKFLADIRDETGFLPVDWQLIRDQINTCENEVDYSELLAVSTLVDDTVLRPSIETGFHAILDRCTIHSHSVWVNLLSCAQDGESLVRQLFPTAIWVPYVTPGLALTKAILERIGVAKNVTIFLQNHGIIVSGTDTNTALAMHQATTDKIRLAYPYILDFDMNDACMDEAKIDGLLFPDQAVYHADPILAKSRAGQETMRACTFLISRMNQADLAVRYINETEREVLLNMESEKFRQNLVHK